jgi:conjugal transfer pilus assembly protein TrbC
VDSVKGRHEAHLDAAQAIADDAPARTKQGLGLMQGSTFDPGGDALQQMAKGQQPPDGTVYIAVSFSMPPQDLRRLAKDAQKAGATVVIQGLVNGSFKETLLKARAVFDQDSLGGVAIDPNVFRAFKVQTAPTFIAARGPVHPCGHGLDCVPEAPANDQVRGNISLAEALRLLAESGSEAADVAATARDKLEG